MKKIFTIRIFQVLALAFVSLFVFSKYQQAFAEEAPGLKIFLKNKCNNCHAISSLGVKVAEEDSKDKEEDEDAGDKKDEKKKDPPDLSGVGLEKESQDTEWLRKYMKKTEKLNDKKHRKKFKGEKEDLDTLVNWLVTLKTKVEQKK